MRKERHHAFFPLVEGGTVRMAATTEREEGTCQWRLGLLLKHSNYANYIKDLIL